MANNFDIQGLYNAAFGLLRGTPFDPTAQDNNIARPAFDSTSAAPFGSDDTFLEMRRVLGSNLPTGKPVFMPVELGGILLPNEPTMIINAQKKIERTALTGSTRKGSVKELISIEDYRILIRGIAINYDDPTTYPENIVKELHDLFLRNESIAVNCALTQLFGIYRLVIERASFPEMTGVQHAQAYEFECVSDEDFTLEIE